jgi:hypothetical protein
MITLTREEAQQVLDALEGSIDAQEWEINDHITKYGEWYRPKRVEYMKQQLANTNSTIETLRARLAQPECVCGEPYTVGVHRQDGPCYQQPEPEPVAWFCELPDNKISIKIVGKPTEGNWEPLYTAPPQREWQGLTDEEIKDILDCGRPNLVNIKKAEQKLKEKNT